MAVPEGAGEALAYIGLGSNLDDPRRQVLTALGSLAAIPGCRLLARSALYATSPVGPVDQPDFVNAAAGLATRLAPHDQLAELQRIERAQGRVRDGTRWGPRTLDLDLLLYGDLSLAVPGLTLPHPELGRRAFVLVPLAEIAPTELEIPGQGRLGDLLAACLAGSGAGERARPIADGDSPPGAAAPPGLFSPLDPARSGGERP
jgi:2-amino-4-hydroxy-6-hydroxymethyldihydropteridine diphosphokinase